MKRRANGLCTCCADGQALNGTLRCYRCILKGMAHKALGKASLWRVIAKLWVAQGGRCAYSGFKLRLGVDASLDHTIPKALRPDLSREPTNLKWVHRDVNMAKGALLEHEFFYLCKRVVAYMYDKQIY